MIRRCKSPLESIRMRIPGPWNVTRPWIVSRPWIVTHPCSVLGLVPIIFVVGCGGGYGRLEPQPVSGQVIVNGEPAAGCTVVFVPRDSELRGKVLLGGTTSDDGTFELTTHETGDGAPVGEYGVKLHWEATKWPGMDRVDPMDPGRPEGPDRLQGEYSNPEQSGLSVTVEQGQNDLEPFRIDGVELLPGSE